MFDGLRIHGLTGRSIIVQTRAGRNVENVIEFEPGFREVRRYKAILEKYGSAWVERKPAVGAYNCAGHVWASRRTTLLWSNQWRLILRDDGYRRLASEEEPRPGDLVLYVDRENNDIIHVGVILRLRQGITSEAARIPWVLSKLDSTFGEVMHFAHDIHRCYADRGFATVAEYWTDRPPEYENR